MALDPQHRSWLPHGYLVSGSRWLVTHPRDADPAGLCRDPIDDKLWAKVWTCTLDAGIELTARAGGLIHVDDDALDWAAIKASQPKKHTTLTLMNAFEYCLCLAGFESNGKRLPSGAVSKAHVVTFGSPVLGGEVGMGLLQYGRWILSSGAVDNFTPVPSSTLDRAVEIYQLVARSRYSRALELLAFINRAAGGYREGHFDEALILTWAVTEACQHEAWRQLDPAAPQPNETAAKMSERLHDADLIDDAFYERLDLVRWARNDWIHELISPPSALVCESLAVALDLYSSVIGEHIEAVPL